MTAVRATLRGVHEGLVEPLVVDGATDDRASNASASSHPSAAGDRTAASDLDGHRVLVLPLGANRREVVVDGWRFEVEVEPERRAQLRDRAVRDRGEIGHSGPAEVRAIIPGVVVSVGVAAGDEVEAGQELLVVEAMKMQNELRAPRAGRVARVAVGERSTIEVGDVLVVIE